MDVSTQIIEVLEFLGEKFGIAFDWSSNNIFPYVEQLCGKIVKWELCTSIAWIVIALIFTAILWVGFAISYHISINTPKRCTADDVSEVLFVIGCMISVIAVLIVCFQIFDIVACNTFPEKVILNYINMHTNLFD